MPRSAIIWTRSRELSLNARYHLMHKTIISWSKCRPLKRSCAEMGSVICGHYRPAPTFSSVCTRTLHLASLNDPPLRLLLGSDAVRFVEQNDLAKMESDRKWKDLSISTDIE